MNFKFCVLKDCINYLKRYTHEECFLNHHRYRKADLNRVGRNGVVKHKLCANDVCPSFGEAFTPYCVKLFHPYKYTEIKVSDMDIPMDLKGDFYRRRSYNERKSY